MNAAQIFTLVTHPNHPRLLDPLFTYETTVNAPSGNTVNKG